MKRMQPRTAFALAAWALLAAPTVFAQDPVTGTWRGQSLCAVKASACREESVVYRFSKTPGKLGTYSASADKIVDGKAVNMGTLEFRYIEDEHALVCDYAQGVWRLILTGEKIEGTLTRPDKTLFRRVTLQKDRQ